MRTAPKIGQRVHFKSTIGRGERWEETREATGTVTKLYKRYDDQFDDDGDFISRGPLLPPRFWKASVRVDARPKWWPYPDSDSFAPDVDSLEPIDRNR